MCRGTYVTISKLITKSYKNNIKMDDDINASIIVGCINIHDDTMNCDTMSQCNANEIHSIIICDRCQTWSVLRCRVV